jgi:anti-sigma factor RsiW
MCPDRDLVSAYVDGEVPNPWKKRLEEHFASCSKCAALAVRYRELGQALRAEFSDTAAFVAAEERNRVKLDSLLASVPEGSARGLRRAAALRDEVPRLRNRAISLPIPIAAAAAMLVLLLGGTTAALALRMNAKGSAVQAAVASGVIALPAKEQARPASMDELLRYLDSSDGQITLTINLPSSTTFGSAGKPVIMRQGRAPRGQTVASPSTGGIAP